MAADPLSAYAPAPYGGAAAELPPIGGITGLIDAIGPGYRAARAGPDWGKNQADYEARVLKPLEAEAMKRGWRGPGADASTAQIGEAAASGGGSGYGMAYGGALPTIQQEEDRRINSLLSWADEQRQRDPKFLAEYADIHNRDQLRAWALARRNADLRAAQGQLDQYSGAARLGGSLIGGLGAGVQDPVSYIPIPGLAGGSTATKIGRQLLETSLKAGAANMAIAAATEPFVRQDAAALGQDRTAGDTLSDLLMAGGTGLLLGGAFKGLEIGGAHVAPAVQKVRDIAGTALDRLNIDRFRQTVPEANWTPDERAAVNAVERTADVAEASPFHPEASGDAAHAGALSGMLDSIVKGGDLPDYPAPVPHIAPRDTGGHFGHILAIEGGTNPDGSFRTSPKGAIGPAQVMPATGPEAARLAGLPWDEHRFHTDADYNKALGEAYYAKQLRDFGDPALAAAAYNAGPGSAAKGTGLRGALAKAARDGRPGNWLDYLPAETRDYVRKFAERSNSVVPSILPEQAFADAVTEPPPAPVVPEIREDVLDPGHDGVMAGWLSGEAGLPVMHVASFSPHEIGVDADLMQFKAGGDGEGVTERLRGVEQWNPAFAGQVMVWEAENGTRLIADGHQRLGLAKRIAAADPAQDIRLNAIVMKEADGISARDARVIAALKNIAEGSGTAVDAAKVVRDAGPHVLTQLPPRSALVRDARPLAALGDEAWGLVVNDLVRPDFAAIVGRLVADDHKQQMALMKLLMQTEPSSPVQAEAIVRQGIAAGFDNEHQLDMFGGLDTVSSRFLQRARVLEKGIQKLRRLKLVYNTAASNAGALEAVGSTIARSESEAAAIANAQAIELVQRLAHSAGPIKEALDAATQSHAAGVKIGDAVDQFVESVRGIDLAAAARESAGAGGDRAGGNGIGREFGADGAASPIPEGPPPEITEAVAAAEAERDIGAGLFDNPAEGEGAKAQAESLEHDARMELATGESLQQNTRGKGQQYHGARGEVPALSEGYYNPDNIYGGFDTFYTTDATDIAAGYGRKSGAARVYRVDETKPVKFFDMEQPRAPAEIERLFGIKPEEDGFVPVAIEQAAAEHGGQPNLRQVMDEIRATSSYEGLSKDDVQEIFDTAIFNLKEQGFGGMSHIGGLKTKREPHLVKIYFDAPNQVALTEAARAAERAAAADPNIADRQKQEAALAAASPLQGSGKTGAEQAGTMGLPMFDAADQPQFVLDADGEQRSLSDILKEIDADEAANKAIRDCLKPGGAE